MIKDPTTGLPYVGANFFWRIKKWNSEHSECTLMIQLRRRRWFGSSKVYETLSRHTPDDIVSTCHRIIERASAARHKRESIHDRDQFLGDYPPKTLIGGNE